MRPLIAWLLLLPALAFAGTPQEERFAKPPFPMVPLSPQSPVRSPASAAASCFPTGRPAGGRL